MSNGDLKRCTLCNGSKRVIGIGLLEKQCPTCLGIGWISTHPVDCAKTKTRKSRKIVKTEADNNEALRQI